MIKVKAFMKVNTSTVTRYTVFNGDEVADYFTVDFLGDWQDFCKATKKLADLEKNPKAYIKFVHPYQDRLDVTIYIKQ